MIYCTVRSYDFAWWGLCQNGFSLYNDADRVCQNKLWNSDCCISWRTDDFLGRVSVSWWLLFVRPIDYMWKHWPKQKSHPKGTGKKKKKPERFSSLCRGRTMSGKTATTKKKGKKGSVCASAEHIEMILSISSSWLWSMLVFSWWKKEEKFWVGEEGYRKLWRPLASASIRTSYPVPCNFTSTMTLCFSLPEIAGYIPSGLVYIHKLLIKK